jgi:hypothetical protein
LEKKQKRTLFFLWFDSHFVKNANLAGMGMQEKPLLEAQHIQN